MNPDLVPANGTLEFPKPWNQSAVLFCTPIHGARAETKGMREWVAVRMNTCKPPLYCVPLLYIKKQGGKITPREKFCV